ncbi:hypothetical protein L218DRAFT_906307 [Marasmius fiardii PR-910]|nr:hypothetical protein L218DRAFT_906307 [Marasmius fiardii PR-910]
MLWETSDPDVPTLLHQISSSEKLVQATQGHRFHSVYDPPALIEFNRGFEYVGARSFIKDLGIPHIRELEFPSIILHRLGSFKLDEELKWRKEDLFSGKNTFLLNTSGSGKTRLLFEGLHDEWGIYFTSYLDSGELGSTDIQDTIIRRLSNKHDFVEFPSDSGDKQVMVTNTALARTYARRVLLAKLIIFQIFLEHGIASGRAVDELRRIWLFFQMCPDVQEDGNFVSDLEDVFCKLSEVYYDRNVGDDTLSDAIEAKLEEIFAILGESTRIFVAIDEANAAVQNLSRCFADDHDSRYPILKVLIKTWMEDLKGRPFVFVVAGTEIPRKHFVCDPLFDDFVWSSNTGGFDDFETQQNYVRQFIPNEVWDSVGEIMMQRLWMWSRGRHRFTSAYITVLLEQCFAKPLTHLDMLIKQATGYFPHDGHHEEDLLNDITGIRQLDFVLLIIDIPLRSYVHLALIDVLVSSKNPGYPVEAIKLVNEGMGRFTDSRCSRIVVDEPLIIARAVTWFTSDEVSETRTPEETWRVASILEYRYFMSHLVNPGMLHRHPPAYLSFGLALLFCRSPRLSDIFTFFHFPLSSSRANQKADIITRRRRGSEIEESPLRDVDHIQQILVTYSTSLKETTSWMAHRHRTPFCIHVSDTSATLIFAIKLSSNNRLWVVMRVLHSLSDEEDVTSRIRDTAHEIHPDRLFHDPQIDGIPPGIVEALHDNPKRCSQLGPYGVLPVIAVLGKEVDHSSLNAVDGDSPFALLNLDKISQAMDIIPLPVIARRIVDAAIQDPRKTAKEEAEDEAEAENVDEAAPILRHSERQRKAAVVEVSNTARTRTGKGKMKAVEVSEPPSRKRSRRSSRTGGVDAEEEGVDVEPPRTRTRGKGKHVIPEPAVVRRGGRSKAGQADDAVSQLEHPRVGASGSSRYNLRLRVKRKYQ